MFRSTRIRCTNCRLHTPGSRSNARTRSQKSRIAAFVENDDDEDTSRSSSSHSSVPDGRIVFFGLVLFDCIPYGHPYSTIHRTSAVTLKPSKTMVIFYFLVFYRCLMVSCSVCFLFRVYLRVVSFSLVSSEPPPPTPPMKTPPTPPKKTHPMTPMTAR